MKTGAFIAIFIGVAVAIGLFASDRSTNEVSVTNFEECVSAGNAVMESYPRQCRHDGELFVEVIDEPIVDPIDEPENESVTLCEPNNRPEACTQQYEPVCGLVQVQCITAPCYPVPETFGNGCEACANQNVISYTEGVCGVENES